jgi:hypothetical protein
MKGQNTKAADKKTCATNFFENKSESGGKIQNTLRVKCGQE